MENAVVAVIHIKAAAIGFECLNQIGAGFDGLCRDAVSQHDGNILRLGKGSDIRNELRELHQIAEIFIPRFYDIFAVVVLALIAVGDASARFRIGQTLPDSLRMLHREDIDTQHGAPVIALHQLEHIIESAVLAGLPFHD